MFQYVNIEECYLCGYLKIKGLTEEYPTLTTFFDGEIISKKYPFLTRKWTADEDVDKQHWVRRTFSLDATTYQPSNPLFSRVNFCHSTNTLRTSTQTTLTMTVWKILTMST